MDDKELPKPDRDYLDVKEHGKQEQVFPNYPGDKKNKGSKALIEKYNINDQAHSDSSKDDFVETTSKFRHADENDTQK